MVSFSEKSVGGVAVCLAALVAAASEVPAQETAVHGGYAHVNGTTLYYETAGEGLPVVLLHGGFMDRRMWDYQFLALAREFQVIRFDHRGFGRSLRNTRQAFSQVEDLRALLDHLDIERAHIVGLSMGANIALDFAVSYPWRVTGLVHANGGMSGTAFQPPPESMQHMMAAFVAAQQEGDLLKAVDAFLANATLFGTVARNNPEAIEKIREMLLDNQHTLLLQQGDYRPSQISPPAAVRLFELRMQVLALVGELNDSNGHDVAQKLEAEVVGSRRVIVPGAGHMVNMEMPQEFNRIVLEFLLGIEL